MSVLNFSGAGDHLDRFLQLAHELYCDDPRWIPPFDRTVRRLLDPEFELWQRPGNAYRCFLVTVDNRVVARAVAGINRDLTSRSSQPVGTIGFFECVDDHHVASDLLGEAGAWLRAGGARIVWAPMNLDIWHGYRCMTKGFDEEPFFGEPYNKPYYPELLERAGFRITAEWDSVEVQGREAMAHMSVRGEARWHMLEGWGYRFENFRLNDWQREVGKLTEIINRSFAGFLGYTAVSPSEMSSLLEAGRAALRPDLFIFAYDESDRLAGFAAAFVELGAAIRSMRGQCDWRAKLRFYRNRYRSDRVNFLLGGVAPEEIQKRSGLGRAGFAWIIQAALNAGYERLMLTLRLKGNAAHGLAAQGAPPPQREYALFEVSV